jgi:hypothetical protein
MPRLFNVSITRKGKYTQITLGRLRLRFHTVTRQWQELCNEADARNAQTPSFGPSPRRAYPNHTAQTLYEIDRITARSSPFRVPLVPLNRARPSPKTLAGYGFFRRLANLGHADQQ